MTTRKPPPAQAMIVGGDIVIRMPINGIADAVRGANSLHAWNTPIQVTDARAFAEDVCRTLNSDDEQGTTMVHELFDKAFSSAADDGAEGVEIGAFNDRGDACFPVKRR